MLAWIIGIGLIGFAIVFAVSWYRIVPSSQAHLVISGSGKSGVYSSNKKFSTEGAGTSYFAIPEFLPIVGRVVRSLDVTIKELNFEQETIEKGQARYVITSSSKFRVVDVKVAAESFVTDDDLSVQLKEIIQAAVREITVKYSIEDARGKRQEVGDKIHKSIVNDFSNWGVELVNFVLVDFKDAEGTTTVSDISKRREVEINTTTRQQNAEKYKIAKIKEAEADEKAKEREIARDKVIGERKQQMAQAVAEKEKIAQEKVYAVKKVQIIKQAEIDKERAIVLANQNKETELIMKEKKKLEGEGDRLRDEEIAKGKAAEVKEQLFAEAAGKEKLQAALNKFTPEAITALTAELQINANKDVGIEGAKAFANSDMKVFAGSDNGGGFDTGKLLTQIGVANSGAEYSMLNKIARPNDLGLTALQLKAMKESEESTKSKKPTPEHRM